MQRHSKFLATPCEATFRQIIPAEQADTFLQGEVACPMCAGWERSMSDARISKSPDTAGHADTASMEPPDLTWLDDL